MPLKITATKPEEEVSKHQTKAHAFMSMTGAQIDAYIDKNVNNPDDVKKVLKFLAKAVRVSLK